MAAQTAPSRNRLTILAVVSPLIEATLLASRENAFRIRLLLPEGRLSRGARPRCADPTSARQSLCSRSIHLLTQMVLTLALFDSSKPGSEIRNVILTRLPFRHLPAS